MKHTFLFAILLIATISCGGQRGARPSAATAAGSVSADSQSSSSESTTAVRPIEYSYRVVRTLPHSTASYTQGFVWDEGTFIEGTGQWGESRLMRVDPESGEARSVVALPDDRFGEGVALLDGLIYQLTWTDGELYVYDAQTLRRTAMFRYSGEGWGLATDSEKLYMSNGTDIITVRNPDNFAVERQIKVRMNGNRVRELNEMEWIEGELWANIYQTNRIVRIDPVSGNVTGYVDLEGLQSPSDRTPYTDVLNGIAYDKQGGRIFVTGKYWNKIYQIELFVKQ